MLSANSCRLGFCCLSARVISRQFATQCLIRQALRPRKFRGNFDYRASLRVRFSTLIDEDPERPLRKHFMSIESLNEDTDNLISALKTDDDAALDNVSHDHCFNLMEAWMERAMEDKSPDAARRAAAILEALEQYSDVKASANLSNALFPSESMYNVVLHAHAMCRGLTPAAESATQIFHRMLERNQIPPSIKTFNIFLNCWAKSYDKEAGTKAEEIIEMMKSRGLQIADFTVSAWMDAWARSGRPDSPKQVLDILNGIIDQYRQGCHDLKPTITMVNIAIQALTRVKGDREGAGEAEELVNRIRRLHAASALPEDALPNTRTYAQLIGAWSECEMKEGKGDAANRAESILQKMVELYRMGVEVKPNSFAFLSCITAQSRCVDQPDAALRAERLLDQMISLFHESDHDRDFRPSIHSANAVITAFARSKYEKDPVERAFKVLDKMKDFDKPDIVSYNAILDMMAKRGMTQQALDLLEQLERDVQSGSSKVVPDRQAYNCVLAALASVGDAKKAEKKLQEMKELHRLGRSIVAPDKISYTSVMNAWSQSVEPDRLHRVQSLLDEMIHAFRVDGDRALKPDAFTVTVFIKTCATMTGTALEKEEALGLAMHYAKLLDDPAIGPATHVTCATLMNAAKNLCDDKTKRRQYHSDIISMTLKSGNLSRLVLAALSHGDKELVPRPIKKEWVANVPHRSRPTTSA